MKEFLNKYSFEFLILSIGLGLGLFEALLVNDSNLSILIVSFSTLLSLSTLAVKKELSEQISEQFELLNTIREISNEHWRAEAEDKIDKFKFEMENWARGNRIVTLNQSIPFQIKLLRRSVKSVYAIHICIPVDSLYLWEKRSGSFSRMIEAYQNLGESIIKKRIMVCDEQILKDNVIQSDRIKLILKRQIASTKNDGLGFDLRVLRQSTLSKANCHTPPDLLIVDDIEVVIVRGANGVYTDLEAIINNTLVKSWLNLFEEYWEMSEPIESYLD